MKRVTGIGGIFFKAKERDKLLQWYHRHLGIEPEDYGGRAFEWRDRDDPERIGSTVWSIFPYDTKYFGEGQSSFMINFRVADLDALLAELQKEGVRVEGRADSEFGRFAWITDPEGNRIELWQPPEGK